MTGTRIAQFI